MQPRWVEGVPGWEYHEVDRHYDPAEETLDSTFLQSPVALSTARDRRRQGEPLEYILRHCHLGDLTVEVNSSVLIPRPETETLLTRISVRADRWPAGPIVDCGTGSGVLAVGLAARTDRDVLATDVSDEALSVARRNARRNDTAVGLVRTDRLSGLSGPFAGIVANLPYVLPGSEKLEPSVREYEPEQALMVPGDPEEFYGDFVRQALERLHPEGELHMELDAELLERVPFREFVAGSSRTVTPETDTTGRTRFLVLSKQS